MFTIGVKRKVVGSVYANLGQSLVGPKQVKVGFPAGEADQDNIQKAIWNEFGTRGGASGGGWGGPIPERPFMRNAVRDNKSKYRNALRTSAAKILTGQTGLKTVLSKLGILGQGDIQAEITALMSPPNSPVTVALKGSSKPLIDSGEMRGAVTYKVDE
jgi:HK97 gp10 family phage protein